VNNSETCCPFGGIHAIASSVFLVLFIPLIRKYVYGRFMFVANSYSSMQDGNMVDSAEIMETCAML
jgi:hypothetical protein